MRCKIPVVPAAAAALALVAAAACSGGSGGQVPEAGGEPVPVTAGVIPIVDVAPIYLGQEQGFFAERGIELTIETGSGGAASVPGVMSGNYQFAFANVTSLLVGAHEGLPLQVLTNGASSNGEQGGDFGAVVVPADSPVRSAADLAGAEVAVNNLQNIGDTSVRESIRQDGGDPTAVRFVELGFPDMPAAVETGRVDAAWIVEPFLTQALESGAREIASNFVDVDENLSIATYFTSAPIAAENPELIDAITEALNESMAYADANPDEVRRILATYTEIEPEVIERIRLPRFPAEVDRGSVTTVAELMVADGLIDAAPDWDEFYR
ncbi:ABC transporter substrate-binding protein [Allonocardiopsis opalescens]|uniref:NitT/TauT family transport system substrate-binding protein n=1 Tax=Allonocardiopsis opalescens TaxID=1144618 RepID=A0A2T0Q7L9_9ACTN|nr:ABC transporter substrate-binding protein [Allonocardiopsis opalescens]PRX99839.1 NitT/TauT family transport system substrate-binding protein [Allonocardiopsis opalescens]